MYKATVALVVAIVFGGVLWVKPQASSETPTPAEQLPPTSVGQLAAGSVLLFADPREAETSCGCAEVIRLARIAGGIAGVSFREFDTRTASAEGTSHGVRVSPTVIITDAAGVVTRLEGESGEVIRKLREAVSALEATAAAEDASAR